MRGVRRQRIGRLRQFGQRAAQHRVGVAIAVAHHQRGEGIVEDAGFVERLDGADFLVKLLADVSQALAKVRKLRLPVVDLEILVEAPRHGRHAQSVARRDEAGAGGGAGEVGDRLRLIVRRRFAGYALVHEVQFEQTVERIGGDAGAQAGGLVVARRRGVKRIGVGERTHARTLIVRNDTGDADRQFVRQDRHVDCAVEVIAVNVVDRGVHHAADFRQIRAAHGDVDRTRRRGAAAQRALRAALDFDLADVEHRLEQRTRRRRGVVDVEFDRAVVAGGVDVEVDAAHGRNGADAVGVADQVQAGNDGGDVFELAQVELFDRFGGDRVNHGGNVLDRFVAAAGRNDDFVAQRSAFFNGCIFLRGGGQGNGERAKAHPQAHHRQIRNA